MAIDTPPQAPAYAIERAAPADSMSQGMKAVAAAMRRVSERSLAAITPEPSQLESTMLPVDTSSKALTMTDRRAMADAVMNDYKVDLSKAPPAGSYIGDRMRLAGDLARINARGVNVTPDPAEAKAFRCRMTAIAMDSRAGAYVEGGEPAAARARASIPREVIEACRQTAQQARVAQREDIRATTRVTPIAGREREAQPVRVTLAAQQPPRVRIDMPAPKRVHVDLEARKTVHIDPVVAKKVHIDPIARIAQQQASSTRGV